MKKILLASCIAAVSVGVNAELTPLSEYELHTVTGQAGVDIELDVGVTIGEIRYTDTEEFDGGGLSDGDGGSLTVSDISLGGGLGRTTLMGAPNPNNTANINGLVFAIDVKGDGDLSINGYPLSNSGGIGAVDFLLTTGEVALQGVNPADRHVLVDSMSIYGGAVGFRMDLDGQTNKMTFRVEAAVDDLDLDMTSGFGINIENAQIKGPGFIEQGGAENPGGVSLTQHAFVLSFEMDYDSEDDGIIFKFIPRPNQFVTAQNVFDIVLPEISVGGDVMGSVLVNNLDLNGISFAIKGH